MVSFSVVGVCRWRESGRKMQQRVCRLPKTWKDLSAERWVSKRRHRVHLDTGSCAVTDTDAQRQAVFGVYVLIHTNAHTHRCMNSHRHVRMHTCIHTHTHTHSHSHTHTHTHSHTHTHTHPTCLLFHIVQNDCTFWTVAKRL